MEIEMANAMASAANQVYVGFRFEPSDRELVSFFLHNLLVKKQPLKPPYSGFIHEFNLLGNELSPSEIWKLYCGDKELYFFCPLKKLSGKRIDRKDGRGGTWSQKDVPHLVMVDGNPNPIGRKRKLRYVNQGSEDHTDWLIDEYSIFSENHCDDNGYDFDSVICRLRKNDRVGKKKMTFSSTKSGANKKMKIEGGSSSTESQIANVADNTKDSPTLLFCPSFSVHDMIIVGGSSSTESQVTNVTDNTIDSSTLLGSPSFNVDRMISYLSELPIPISEVGDVDDSATYDSQNFHVDDFVADINGGVVGVCNPSNFEDVWNQPLDSSYSLFKDNLWA